MELGVVYIYVFICMYLEYIAWMHLRHVLNNMSQAHLGFGSCENPTPQASSDDSAGVDDIPNQVPVATLDQSQSTAPGLLCQNWEGLGSVCGVLSGTLLRLTRSTPALTRPRTCVLLHQATSTRHFFRSGGFLNDNVSRGCNRGRRWCHRLQSLLHWPS